MNVIVLKFSLQYTIPLVMNLVKGLSIKNLYYIGSKSGHPDNADLKTANCNFIPFTEPDLFNALFADVDWQEIEPLDKDILLKMAPYESEILRLFERDFQVVNKDDHASFEQDYYETKISLRAQNFSTYINQVEMSGEEKRRRYYRYLRFWNDFLNKNKIDLTITTYYPHFPYEYILYRLCQARGIRTIIMSHTPLPGKWLIYEDIDKSCEDLANLPRISDDIEVLQQSFSRNTRDEIHRILTGEKPYYMVKGYVENLLKNDKIEPQIQENNRIRRLRPAKGDPKKKWSIFNAFDRMLIMDKIHFKFRHKSKGELTRRLMAYYESKATKTPDFGKNYIYLALHYQPEASNSPVGGYYANQLLIADLISYYLPEGWFLYVKDHPAQSIINRNIDFYYDLSKNKRVVIMSKSVDTFELSKNAKAVATIAGTAAMECLLFGKPVFLFGASPLMYCNGTFNIRTKKDIIAAIEAVKNGFLPNKIDVYNYIKRLDDRTVEAVHDHSHMAQFGVTGEQYTERMTAYYLDYILHGSRHAELDSASHAQQPQS